MSCNNHCWFGELSFMLLIKKFMSCSIKITQMMKKSGELVLSEELNSTDPMDQEQTILILYIRRGSLVKTETTPITLGKINRSTHQSMHVLL